MEDDRILERAHGKIPLFLSLFLSPFLSPSSLSLSVLNSCVGFFDVLVEHWLDMSNCEIICLNVLRSLEWWKWNATGVETVSAPWLCRFRKPGFSGVEFQDGTRKYILPHIFPYHVENPGN